MLNDYEDLGEEELELVIDEDIEIEFSEEDLAQAALEQNLPEPIKPLVRPALNGRPWAAIFSTTNEDEPIFD